MGPGLDVYKRQLAKNEDVLCLEGNAISYEVQTEAGVPEADLVIACTDGDELNMLCCLLAKKRGAARTLSLIHIYVTVAQGDTSRYLQYESAGWPEYDYTESANLFLQKADGGFMPVDSSAQSSILSEISGISFDAVEVLSLIHI